MNDFNMEEKVEETLADMAKRKASHGVVREICRCGHNSGAHASQALPGTDKAYLWEVRGRESCTPGRQACKCAGFVLAATASNVRLFRFKTVGRTTRHALYMGIMKARSMGVDVQPAGDWSCNGCGSTEAPVSPVPFSALRKPLRAPGPYTLLLCGQCIADLDAGVISFEVEPEA